MAIPAAGPPASGATAGDPQVQTALGLGWHMAELYGVIPVPEESQHQRMGETLSGLGDLGSHRRHLLGLDQVDFALTQLAAAVRWPDTREVPKPDTGGARAALQATQQDAPGARERRAAYRQALWNLHVDVMVTLQAANPAWGSAYRLGRGLADTTRPAMSAGELAAEFGEGRIDHLIAAVTDLSSLLQPHVGRAVATSLGWWRDEVSDAEASDAQAAAADRTAPRGPDRHVPVAPRDSPRRRARLRARDAEHPVAAGWERALRRPPGLPASDVAPLRTDDIVKALPRQGHLWRAVLTGEKNAVDLLEPDDYLQAARQFSAQALRLARTAPLPVWAGFAALIVAVFLAVLLIGFAVSGSAVGRTATGIAAVAAALAAGWRTVWGGVRGGLARLETPLWGAALDLAIADAVTLPPVGAPRDGRTAGPTERPR